VRRAAFTPLHRPNGERLLIHFDAPEHRPLKRHKCRAPSPAADTSGLEREIDQQVYALHGLTPEEIKIVEDSQ
jgi:hypothetical protein